MASKHSFAALRADSRCVSNLGVMKIRMEAQRDFEGGLIGSRIVALIRQNIIPAISCSDLLSIGAAEFPAVRSVELSNIHAPQEAHSLPW